MSLVRSERRGSVAEIALNRPEKLNAFDVATVRELRLAVRQANEDAAVRAILLTGAGKAFTGGGDVDEMIANAGNGKEYVLSLTAEHHPLVHDLLTGKPVVTAVNGAAAGGGFGLALCGDIRLGCEHTKFKPAYFRIGVVPDGGITWALPRLVGIAKAQEILYRDRAIGPEEALALGLLHRVVAAKDLTEEARREAEALAAAPAFALASAKHLLNTAFANDMPTQLADERRLNGESGGTADFREGIRAFKEKRQPKFE